MSRRNGSVAEAQLTFKGVEFEEEIEASSFKLPALATKVHELEAKERATVALMSPDGEVLAQTEVRVASIAFVRHPATSSQHAWVERVHKLTPIE